MEREPVFFNAVDEVGGYDGGISEKEMRQVEAAVREQVPGAKISLGEFSLMV